MSGNKATRPLVDSRCFDLARAWLTDGQYEADRFEDAVWDLADELQQAIEQWTAREAALGRMREDA